MTSVSRETYSSPTPLRAPASPSIRASMAEDAEWVLESVLAFLGCPVWTEPVTDFIEQKCSVFDDEEENKLSYTEVHNEYKELVEKLIQGHLNDIGIDGVQFQEACLSPLAQSPDVKNILQPLLAVEDFASFKEMMVQRNIELQLQAIQIIQQRNGALPECLQNGSDIISDLEQQEMKLLSEALRLSKEEYEMEQLRRKEKNAACVKENHSKTSSSGAVASPQKEPVHLEDKRPSPKGEKIVYHPEATIIPELSSKEAANTWMEQARKEAGIQGSVTNLTQTEKDQLRERAEYLKQRRAELLAKKNDSKKKISSSEEHDEETAPSSLQGKELTEEEMRNLQRRKQLAEKLKEEVINK
ncbi:cilia- and flagella-associated protein 36 isoform X2 [Hyperolius riggenbachi]|uniref:cilia- and flagella-associated protein 36 isoform X2 n=1 Tax=Hyperolius riggenbachi TaxID=752182 RepID=UPI0035A2DE3C